MASNTNIGGGIGQPGHSYGGGRGMASNTNTGGGIGQSGHSYGGRGMSSNTGGGGGQVGQSNNTGGGRGKSKFGGRGARRGRTSTGQIICYGCGKSGHIAANCPDATAKIVSMDEEDHPDDDVTKMFAAEFHAVDVVDVKTVTGSWVPDLYSYHDTNQVWG